MARVRNTRKLRRKLVLSRETVRRLGGGFNYGGIVSRHCVTVGGQPVTIMCQTGFCYTVTRGRYTGTVQITGT